nr:MAG TPA: hypothetical protein [Caudoviricetes sp.]
MASTEGKAISYDFYKSIHIIVVFTILFLSKNSKNI